jgi:glutaconate CoA-transferase subunit A
MQVRALALDFAILHVPGVDAAGNVYAEGDFAVDGALARAARRVYVCYEREVPVEPRRAVLSCIWVDALLAAPRGAQPTGCHPDYGADLETVARWAAEGARAGADLLAAPGSVR